jgi:hypothetical protein
MYTKTKLFIAFLCLFAFFKSNGQKSLFLSEVRKEKTPATDVLLFKDYVYLLKVSRDRSGFSKKWYYHIQKINNDGQMELESKFQPQINDEKTRPTKIFGIGNDMYMLSKQGKSLGFMDFFLTKLEKESLVPTEEYIKLTNIKGKDWLPQSIVSSPKQKYLLFTLEIHAAKRKERKYQFILVGENLEIALNETISIPESDSDLKISNISVDDDGNIFLLGFDNRSSKKPGESWGYLLRYTRATKEIKGIKIQDNQDQYLKSLNLEATPNELILGGLYSEERKNRDRKARGLVYAKYPKDFTSFIPFTYLPYSTDVIHHNLSPRDKKILKKRNEIEEYPSLKLNEIKVLENNHSLFISEQIYLVQRFGSKPFSSNSQIPHSGDIIVSYISPEGEMLWSVPISSQNKLDGFNHHYSYFLYAKESGINILFNNKKRINGDAKGAYFTEIKMDGSFSTNALYDYNIEGFYISTDKCKVFEEGRIFLYCRSNAREKIGIFKF